jgi:hypothetical protein
MLLHRQPAKQPLAAGKQRPENVEKRRLAEATQAREQRVLVLFDQAPAKAGLVRTAVGVALCAHLAKVRLNADG